MNYESNIERLNEILEKLSNEKLTFEEGLNLYDEASRLYKECNDYLSQNIGKVYKIKQDLEKYNEERMN